MKTRNFFAQSVSFFAIFGVIGMAVFLFFTHTVSADPVLSVSVSPRTVLLGGQATYRVTVENTDNSDKGYNLSFSSVFSSDRTAPEGQVRFYSASDEDGNLIPTATATDHVTGETTIKFVNIRDLAPQESYSFTLVVDLSGDATWEAMDDLIHELEATVNTVPDGSGSDITGTDNVTADVMPIALMHKSVNQSTSTEQATGTLDRVYSYDIDVQNNYTDATDDVIVEDVLPDGIEFLGITSGHTCTDDRDNATGETVVECDLGTMNASDQEVITYDAGIRYDYFGTDNGGTNRLHDDFDGTPVTGTPIPDKTVFTNYVDLDAEYQGTDIDTQSSDASVTAAYATVNKSGNISHGGNGDTINYTITYATSEYYNILDDDSDDNDTSITIHDLLPDGYTYEANSANITPSAITVNGDGTTDIYWNSSVLSAVDHSSSLVITFAAEVDDDWDNSDPIVANDSLINEVFSHGQWEDQIDNVRQNGDTDSHATSGFDLDIPSITKEVEDPNNTGTWLDAVDATVGDGLKFRVRFNTDDGTSPLITNINAGSITVTDWLPPGMSYNSDAVEVYSSSSDFTGSNFDGPPTTFTVSGLVGVEWELGNVAQGGWWQAEFTVDVEDVPSVTEGVEVNNLWKMTGINSTGGEYSDRDSVDIEYQEPYLELTKNVTNVASPLGPSDAVEYTVTIENDGGVSAKDVLVTDTIANGMRGTAPVITAIDINGTSLTENMDYKLAYNSGSGVWTIDLNNTSAPAVETDIPAGEILTIVYNATVDSDLGMYARLDNIATVAYNTQDEGTGRQVDGTSNASDDNTDDASVRLARATVSKNASAGPFTIGEVISYTVDVTVPEGAIGYWPNIRDQFDADGVVYVPGSATLTNISGSPDTAASFDSGSAPSVSTGTANQTRFTWNLSNPIDNRSSGTDYVFRLAYNVQYTGVDDDSSWGMFTPTANDQLGNTARLRWNDHNVGSRATNQSRSNSTSVNIDQPLLQTVKSITSTGPYSSGSTINYETVITNVGYSEAFDIMWDDQISAYTGSASLTSVTHSTTGSLVDGTHFSSNFSGNPVTLNFNGGTTDTNLAVGESMTVAYSVVVTGNVGAGAQITNTADINWSSLNNAIPQERTYNDQPEESAYTSDTDSETATIFSATFDKSIMSPASENAEIGETVDYRVRVTVPAETHLYSPTMDDVITADGMEYVNNSMSVLYVSGNPEVAATISVAPTVNATSPNPGATINFVFDNDIDNANTGSPTGDTDYVFDVTYQMLVTGLSDGGAWIWDPAVTGHSATNTATGRWNDGSQNHTVSDNATLDIIQPYLTLAKNFDVETAAGGDTATATVVITNDGNGTGYEYDGGADFTDTMPDGFTNPQMVSMVHSINGTLATPADYTFTTSGNDFTIEYNSAQTDLEVDETLTLAYTTDIDPLIGAGANISNDADVNYSSMDGVESAERVYNDVDPLEGDADTDSDNVRTSDALMTKVTNLVSGEATIGEEFDYIITVDVPQDTTVFNAEVGDVVPDGLTVIDTIQSPDIGSITAVEQPNGTTPITWVVGDIANDPVDQITLTVHVRVDNAFSSTILLDGLPAIIDGDAQDTLTNDATCTWDDADTGGTSHDIDDDVTVTVIEPHPTIVKDVNSNVAGIGDTMNYSVVIANDGTSTLLDVDWQDTLPDTLFDAGSSPTLVSITHSDTGALTDGVDYVSSFSTNPATVDFAGGTSNTVLAPGEQITILYNAVVENTVGIGDILTNDAQFDGISHSTNGRAYGGNDSESITIASTSIGDNVWHDNDKDGIQDVGESGIANVTVELRDGAGNPLDDPLNPGTPYVVQTDGSGDYLFTNLSAGNYRIHFDTSAGYAFSPQDQGGDDDSDSDADPVTGMTSVITLGYDEHITNVDAGFITASIGIIVWLDINGDGVVSGSEIGYPGVVVRLLDSSGNPVNDPMNAAMPYVIQTDGLGSGMFDNLLAGNYQIQVDAPAGYSFTLEDQGSDDTVDSDVNTTGRTATIALGAGEENVNTAAGIYEPVSIGDRVWQDTNADGVQDVGEPGLANVEVRLLDDTGSAVDNPNNPGNPYITTTDASGNYLFENLLPGDYQMEFVLLSDYNFSPQDSGGDDATDSDVSITTGRTNVASLVSGESNMTFDAGMYELATLGDKVWRDDERDGIQANWESGLENVVAELLDDAGNPVDEPSNPGTAYAVTTDASGNYLFENLVPGDYQVRFTPPADHDATNQGAGSDDARDSDIDTVTLTTGTVTLASSEQDTSIDAGFYALYANVFDPPFAEKIVGDSGNNEVEWTMVWINDGNMAAIATQVLDNVPMDTVYVDGSLSCDARGASTTAVCIYDVAEDRVRWEGDIAPDPGGTNEEDSLNEVVIIYRTTVNDDIDEVENQGSAHWDENGDGEFGDDIDRGQQSVESDDPRTTQNLDPTIWQRVAEGNSSIGNYIWHDKNSDGVQDKEESGLENIRVKLTWAGPDDKFGNGDDHEWRTDTNHNGHYIFEDLVEGKYKVKVKEEDVKGWVQTYDPGGKMNNRAKVTLGINDQHTKADFGYNNSETELAKTGDNTIVWIVTAFMSAGGVGIWKYRTRAKE